jgi:HAD superfamily hydrolase (TIGR01509 family)
MQRVRAILFDFGGTLDGPGEPWIRRFEAAYGESGIDVSPERMAEVVGYATREAYHAPRVASFDLRATIEFHVNHQFARLGIENRAAADRIVAHFVARTSAALASSSEFLRRLRYRFGLGVVSNFYGNVARILNDCGIAPLLSVIVDSNVAGVSKPDPRIFELAVDRLRVRPSETLHVGDSLERDVIPAHKAGLRTAWLCTASEPGDSPADLRIRSLDELERVLRASQG